MKLAAAAMLVVSVAGARDWARYTSSHFELYSDARPEAARQTLTRLELIRHVFLETIGSRGAPIPVRVFLFESERSYRPFRPNRSTPGFYQSGPERDYIAMLASDDEAMRVAYHEYVHLVLNHSAPPLPQWLEEGTAEFYSTLESKGDRLIVGLPVRTHLRTLASRRWIDAATLATVNKQSGLYNETNFAGMFYAQSWALVHMLNLAAPYRKTMPLFTSLIERGIPVELAFEKAFSRDFDAALEELRAYLSAGALPALTLTWKPPDPVEIEMTQIAPEEAEIAQVELLLLMGLREQAGPRLDRLERAFRDSPRALTALAQFALGAGRRQESAGYFERAIQAASTDSTTYFEYAMLLRDNGGPRDRVRKLLAEATGRNPKHAEAHFILGLMASQDGDERAAAERFEQAVAVLPRQSYFWHALAISYHRLGRTEEARGAARRSLESAATEQQREMAVAAAKLTAAGAAPTTRDVPRPEVVTPKGWEMPKGGARVEGVLEHIDCLGRNARFHVRAGGNAIALYVADPGAVLLKTPSSLTFQFSCGPQKPRRVVIEYIAKPNPAYKTQGEITAIEFP